MIKSIKGKYYVGDYTNHVLKNTLYNIPLGSLTPRTINFLSITGITDPIITLAINTYDLFLISSGLQNKKKAVYLMVGGTASTHKLNFMNPLDNDGAFRIDFNGGWVHSSTGAKPNGTNGWGDTHYISGINDLGSSSHLNFYSRTIGVNTDVMIDMGEFELGLFSILQLRYTDLMSLDVNVQSPINISNTDASGYFLGSRTSTANWFMQKNTTQNNYTGSYNVSLLYNNYIGAANVTGSPLYFSNRECAYASLGDGLTTSEGLLDQIAVQTMQTTLGRQV